MSYSREHRSAKYQYLIMELSFDDKHFDAFSNADSIRHHLNPWAYNEELLLLEDKLKIEFWLLAKKVMTKRQYEVYKLITEGYKQQEIGKILKVSQSTVTKCLNGCRMYVGETSIKYGGIIVKMKKEIAKNETIKQILNEMDELRTEII